MTIAMASTSRILSSSLTTISKSLTSATSPSSPMFRWIGYNADPDVSELPALLPTSLLFLQFSFFIRVFITLSRVCCSRSPYLITLNSELYSEGRDMEIWATILVSGISTSVPASWFLIFISRAICWPILVSSSCGHRLWNMRAKGTCSSSELAVLSLSVRVVHIQLDFIFPWRNPWPL
jgi:hypothetical protein